MTTRVTYGIEGSYEDLAQFGDAGLLMLIVTLILRSCAMFTIGLSTMTTNAIGSRNYLCQWGFFCNQDLLRHHDD